MGAVVFVALIILGSGVISYATDANATPVAGLGPIPGVVGIAAATLVWILMVRRPEGRGAGAAVLAGLAAAAAHGAAFALAALPWGIVVALAVAGHFVTSGFVAVTVIAGILAAAGVFVAVRAGTGTPRWPWEKDDFDEE